MSTTPRGDSSGAAVSGGAPRPADRPEVVQFRAAMMDYIGVPFIVLGLVAVTLVTIIAVGQGHWYYAVIYWVVYLGFVTSAFVFKPLPLHLRTRIFLVGYLGVGIAAMARTGLNGAGVPVLVGACGLTVVLHGLRAGLWATGVSLLAMGAVGTAMVSGWLVVPPAQLDSSHSAVYWAVTCLVFTVVSVGLVVPYRALQTRLEESLETQEARALALRRSNEQLLAEIERREQAEQASRESEARYRQIFELAPAAILEVDISGLRELLAGLRGRGVDDLQPYVTGHPEIFDRAAGEAKILDFNPATLDLFGAGDRSELMQALERPPSAASLQMMFNLVLDFIEGETRVEAEVAHQRLDGRPMDLLLRITSGAADGKKDRALAIMVDITARKQLEQRLARSQKMEAIGTLAGGIAHDFNNLLMGVQGCASLMLADLEASHPHREHLQTIEELVKHGAGLTGQLLGFARRGKYVVQPVDLNEVVRRTAGIFSRAKKEIRVHQKLADGLRTVEVDQGQLEQVLLNLYVNAWQAMPDGGDLYLQTANHSLGAPDAAAVDLPAGEYVKVTVTDTGTGMDPRTRERIFEPFFTTKQMGRGTGLGLASAYGILKNHGGNVSVTSAEGQGSTFELLLPVSGKRVRQSPELPPGLVRGHETVLMVDDEQTVLEVGRMLLERLGYTALTASSGQRALELMAERGEEVALVVLDLVMPGMGGGETFDRLRERHPELKVLLASGYSRNDQVDQIVERGCRGFIQKPFDLARLSLKLREVLDGEPDPEGTRGRA
jgi:signal transduction histidine kinase/ActR/RegA family two-component response regulator